MRRVRPLIGALALAACALARPALAQHDDHVEHPAAVVDEAHGVGEEAYREAAHAEVDHTEHHPATIGEVLTSTGFLATVLNFVIFAFLVVRLARRPVGAFFGGRRREIEEGLAEARRLKAEADETKAKYEARMGELDRELAALREEMIRSGEKARDRLLAEAEERAARLRRDAEFAIEQRVKQLRHDLMRDTVEAALRSAKQLLADRMTPEDQTRLADVYLERLREKAQEALGDGRGATP